MDRNIQFYGGGMGKALGGSPIQRDYAMDPRRMMADQLIAQGSSTAPVQSPLEGLARALQAGVGGYFGGQAREEMKGRETALNKDMMGALGAMQPTPATPGEFQGPGPARFGASAGSPGGLQGGIDYARGTDNPDMAGFVQQMTMQQAMEQRDARLLAESRGYGEKQALATHKRSLETEEMKRNLSLEDKAAELQERDRLARARDAAKPWIAAGMQPPAPGGQSPQAGGGTLAPPMSLAEAQAQQAGIKAEAVATGKAKGEAVAQLPMVEHNAKYLIGALDAVLAPKMDDKGNPIIENGRYVPGVEHAGLENAVGAKSAGAIFENIPYIGGTIPGTDAADFTAKLEQVTGKQFLQAFETLKGGGQITEIEGTKATQALANLSTAQTEKQFREALLQFRYEVEQLTKIAKQRAGVGASLKSKYGLE